MGTRTPQLNHPPFETSRLLFFLINNFGGLGGCRSFVDCGREDAVSTQRRLSSDRDELIGLKKRSADDNSKGRLASARGSARLWDSMAGLLLDSA